MIPFSKANLPTNTCATIVRSYNSLAQVVLAQVIVAQIILAQVILAQIILDWVAQDCAPSDVSGRIPWFSKISCFFNFHLQFVVLCVYPWSFLRLLDFQCNAYNFCQLDAAGYA
jgi:hypothetical protein